MFQAADRSDDALGDVRETAEDLVVIFRHPSVDRDWLQRALSEASPTSPIEISAEFLFDFVDSTSRLGAARRAARKHETSNLTMDHAWYGVDQARIDTFGQSVVESLGRFLFRRAEPGKPSVVMVSPGSFDDPRMSGLMAWTTDVWPQARIVFATPGEAASAASPPDVDALGALLLAAEGSAEAWFSGSMLEPGAATSFMSNWFTERSAQ